MSNAEKLAGLEAQVDGIDRDLQRHLVACEEAYHEVNKRFGRLERVVWQAAGGVIVLVWLAQILLKR